MKKATPATPSTAASLVSLDIAEDAWLFTKEELDDFIEKISDSGECSPSLMRLLVLVEMLQNAVPGILPEVRRIMITFGPEKENTSLTW